MRFIREHKILISVLSIILSLLVVILVSYKIDGKRGPVFKIISTGVFTVQKTGMDINYGIKKKVKSIFRTQDLIKENEKLKEENVALKNKIIDINLEKHEITELKELKKVFNYIEQPKYKDVIASRIIAIDNSNIYSSFTVDGGTENGVYVGSIVINGDGLVGTVTEVGATWSKVVSIVDENKNVSFKVLRQLDLMGILKGDGKGSLKGFMLDNEASVIEGDSVITSGIGIFPEGIPIGTVKKVKYNKDTQLKTIEVEPNVSFNSLQKVVILI